MRRVVVVGTTGSGKTSVARRLAGRLGVPHVELDALQWEPNWTAAETSVLRDRAARAVAGDGWVVDGNYSKVRDIVWPRAEVLIWLDYSLPVIIRQLARRTIRRILRREELWSGNKESFRVTFFSRDSLFVWVLQTYRRHRREYAELPRRPEHAHLRVVRLRSPAETRAWLAGLAVCETGPEAKA
jgi:adenylate kinase family enzyme